MDADSYRLQVITRYEGRDLVDAWVNVVMADPSRPINKPDEEGPLRDRFLAEGCLLSHHRLEWLLSAPKPGSRDEFVKARVPTWMSDQSDAILCKPTWRAATAPALR
jgi:hypothetical protein